MAKAMSTLLSDAFVFVFRLLVFILFGNPLSMWSINLLFPWLAAKFARNELYFGPKIYAFYEQHALKWPFYWSKNWILLEKMASYSTKQQVQYFLEVSFKNKTEVEVLNAMKKQRFWPETFEILFFKYGDKKLPYPPELHVENFVNHSISYRVYLTVSDFMMRHTRLSYNALAAAIQKAMYNDFACEELKKYLASGALNSEQLKLLIDAVSTNNGSGNFPILGVLREYVKRYNLRKEHWQRIKEHYPQSFIDLLREAEKTVEQVTFVHSLRPTSVDCDVWQKFCQETAEILPVAQGKMVLWQYDIFHNTGHKLDSDAILALLRRSDEKMWRLIFEREEIDDNLRLEISSHANWWPVYQDVIKTRKA